jgi:hypothetical protein
MQLRGVSTQLGSQEVVAPGRSQQGPFSSSLVCPILPL